MSFISSPKISSVEIMNHHAYPQDAQVVKFKKRAPKSKDKNGMVRYVIGILLTVSVSSLIIAQEQDTPQNNDPVEFSFAISGDLARNFTGGIERSNAYLGNVDITATINTERAKLWKGGTFFVYLLNNHGTSISQHVGDIQGVDNIEADAHSRLYEIWYKQSFNKLAITVGQHDLNSEFCMTEYGGLFVHSSFGIQPDISGNIPIPIFPVATLGVIVNYQIGNNMSLLTGIYDGDPGTQSENPNSLNWNFTRDEGTTNIVEIQYHKESNNSLIANYKIGAWSHTADKLRGIYAIMDRKIFSEKNDSKQGLGMFAQIGIVPKSGSHLDSYASVGFHYAGIFTDDDSFGIACNRAYLTEGYEIEANSTPEVLGESTIELTYHAQIGKYLSLQPDLQYVMHPGGTAELNNAFLGILRIVAQF